MGKWLAMFDGLRNVLSGLGGQGDKSTGSTYQLIIPGRPEIDACYRGTWLGRKIHDIPALDMTREWRAWQADDDQIEAIEQAEIKHKLRMKARKALVHAKLYGGSALIMGLPGQPDQPAPPTIPKGGLRYLHLVHRHQLTLGDEDRDLTSERFGTPKLFRLTASTDTLPPDIHPSRVIPFVGNPLPEGALGAGVEDWFWGDPLLAAVFTALTTHDTGIAAISALMNEAKVDVVHVPGLMDNLSNETFEKQLIERFNIAALLKSITNVLLLDGGDGTEGAGEQWETRTVNWDGLPDVQRTLFQLVSGAADIPATRLIGQAPVGMNATGDSDIRNYYDMLSSLQNSDLTPALSTLDDYLIMDALGTRDPSIFYNWNPLWQMTPKEKAERDWNVAQTAEKYANMGVVPDDALAVAVQNRLIEDGVFPGLEAALDEAAQVARLELTPEERMAQLPAPANDPGADPNQTGAADPKANMTGNSSRRAANDRARAFVRDQARTLTSADELLLTDAAPRTLYVSRQLLNAAELRTWAEGQGFKDLVPAGDMHVTITASREPVDWLKIEPSWTGSEGDGKLTVTAGGPRVVEPLGPNKAPVLFFSSWELTYRHGQMREAGASFDFEQYQPHVTISYEGVADGFDWDAVEPFTGKLQFGPEIFKPFDADWSPGETE